MVKDKSKCVPIDGLPISDELIINREETLSYIENILDTASPVLVSGPPFSGKTCLYQLFTEKYKSKVISLSFATLITRNDENEAYEDLEKYFHREIGMSIEECLFNKEGKILVTDETQNIYHVSKFWSLFKIGINTFCSIYNF
jgi:predicted AAA+ superfamily ATPase